MAYLIFPEELLQIFNTKLNIYNWQTISSVGPREVHVAVNFQVYIVSDFTLEELHEANLRNKRHKIEKRFSFQLNYLSCTSCGGKGALDWIETATKAATEDWMSLPQYMRNPKGPVYKFIRDDGTIFFSSTAYAKRGFELCKKCLGSGLHHIKNEDTPYELVEIN